MDRGSETQLQNICYRYSEMFYVSKLHAFGSQPAMEGRLVIYESRNLYIPLQGSAHGGQRLSAARSTLISRPLQHLVKTSKTEYFKYKNMAVL